MRAKCYSDYFHERESLSPKEIDKLLESGRKWDFSSLVASRGIVIFPHTFLRSCGSYIAAAVHAALDSGADSVVVLGVLHATSPLQKEAREKEKNHTLAESPLRAIYGDDLPSVDELHNEYSLHGFLFLWNEEIKRRNCKAPKLYCRYPYLANRNPESIPGMADLKKLVRNSALLATSDFSHHGVAYDEKKELCLPIGNEAREFAKNRISKNLSFLETGMYEQFYAHCLEVKSDSFDVGTVLHHLRGPLASTIHDVTLVDTSSLYAGTPTPSWVATSLVTCEVNQDGHDGKR